MLASSGGTDARTEQIPLDRAGDRATSCAGKGGGQQRRRWGPAGAGRAAPGGAGGPLRHEASCHEAGTRAPQEERASPSAPPHGRVLWLLGQRCVELRLPACAVRTLPLPLDVRSGSRAVHDPASANVVFVLENGSSRVWHLSIGDDGVSAEQITDSHQSSRFRSSLGSRLLHAGPGLRALVVTGTPGRGACDAWRFDLASRAWAQLRRAPHAILSSAAFLAGDALTVVGGWSKERGCHGHTQVLPLRDGGPWSVSSSDCVPWRRPGAGALVDGRLLVALGWMECEGDVGSPSFRLLRRNGAAQRARTSSSCLCESSGGGPFSLVARLPLADSFEHNGELHRAGDHVYCIGRDHIQVFDTARRSWQGYPLPRQLQADSSNSWVKHCGSWAMVWLPGA